MSASRSEKGQRQSFQVTPHPSVVIFSKLFNTPAPANKVTTPTPLRCPTPQTTLPVSGHVGLIRLVTKFVRLELTMRVC